MKINHHEPNFSTEKPKSKNIKTNLDEFME